MPDDKLFQYFMERTDRDLLELKSDIKKLIALNENWKGRWYMVVLMSGAFSTLVGVAVAIYFR